MRYSRYWFPLAAMMAWSAGGCAHNTKIHCPALRVYDQDFNTGLADELDPNTANHPAPWLPRTHEAIGDYIALRDACKAAAAG